MKTTKKKLRKRLVLLEAAFVDHLVVEHDYTLLEDKKGNITLEAPEPVPYVSLAQEKIPQLHPDAHTEVS